ncbi:MAG: H4MPT-linked C1 transfer pathway protein [Methanobacteriaceae archaeon]|jgi:probable H4MPT-linked C1 transfer pathway protein|nr:H4MPT-linked C1 transfer pathway protein [Candidatus Methanorudis spinitermitis]
MRIAGFDIGGANTDLAIVDFDKKGEITNINTDFKYFPMWSNKKDLGEILLNLIDNNRFSNSIDAVGISMTAELVDAYNTKKEGVLEIAKEVKNNFDIPLVFIGINGALSYEELKKNPLDVAAANWIATSQIAGKLAKNCIFVDTGSTTTDIIPIKNGCECAKGRSDMMRLATGELVYTGLLRTNISTFVDEIYLDGNNYKIASELFAISADVYNVLGKITMGEYSCETPDGSGKSIEESKRRISRVLCADLDMLSSKDINKICNEIYKKQIQQIMEGLEKVSKRENLDLVISTGLGKDILATSAAQNLNLNVKSMNEFLTDEECIVAPAIGTAILVEKYLNS